METKLSNASTATTDGSFEEIRDGLTLRHAVAAVIWEAMPGGETHPVPFEELGPDGREEQLASADAACRLIAERVVLPRVLRCLREANDPGVINDTRESAMVLAICYESVIRTLTGLTAGAAHEWVMRHGTLVKPSKRGA